MQASGVKGKPLLLSVPARLIQQWWSLPVCVLVFALLSFGLFLPELGFYWDDWPSVMIAQQQGGAGFVQFFALDRPTTAWSYLLLMPVFGVSPLAWQIFTLCLRVLAALLVWSLVRNLWPQAGKSLAVSCAFLFVVYPVFRQQSMALVYHQVWIEYIAFLVSLTAMVAAIRYPKRFWLFTALSLVGLIANLLISEYFMGVELARILIVWLAVGNHSPDTTARKRLLVSLRIMAPYLVLVAGYVIWRLFLIDLPGKDRNDPHLLYSLFSTPLQTIPQLLQMVLQDSLYVVLTTWYDALRPDLINLKSPALLGSWAVVLLAFAISLFYQLQLFQKKEQPESETVIYRQMALLGLVILLFGPAPAWATGRQVIVGIYSDRHALPGMFGTVLAICGFVAWMVRERKRQVVLLSICIALAVGFNVRQTNDFRWARILHNRFYWQLYWRAPYIQPHTPVFADGELLPKMGLYSTALGINLLYPLNAGSTTVNYWFFSLGRDYSYRMNELLNGMTINETFRQFTFSGSANDSLVIFYQPNDADCLRVLGPDDVNDPLLPAITAQTLKTANLSRIQPQAKSRPSTEIFGPEPEHSWCYLFQKADLARQQQDWQQVAALGDEAREQGYDIQNLASNTPQEWLPFIEGFTKVNRTEEARQMTHELMEKDARIGPRLCDLWHKLRAETNDPAVVESADDVLSEIPCAR